jgi:hypothetical protein
VRLSRARMIAAEEALGKVRDLHREQERAEG